MDKETRGFLEGMQAGLNEFKNEMQEFRKETSNRFESLEGQVKELKTGQEELKTGQGELKTGQEELKNMVGELDPKNANRHIELQESISQLRKDFSTVEIVTSSNYLDLARLKSVK